MTQFQINFHLTSGARVQLANSSESIVITQNNSDGLTELPSWVSFYKGCPVGINPINTIKWTESWDIDYSTQVFNQGGTVIQGAGDLYSSQVGNVLSFNSTAVLDNAANWTNKSGDKMMCAENNHQTPVTFIYYVKTSVNSETTGNTTSHPIYTSSSFIENGGTEKVTLIQTVNVQYVGNTISTPTIIATSGSTTATTLTLNTTGTTDITGDFSEVGGWSFYLGKPAKFQLKQGSDILNTVTFDKMPSLASQSNDRIEGLLTGTLTVGTAIKAAVVVFILGSINLNVTHKLNDTTFRFSYNGTSTRDAILKFVGHTINFRNSTMELAYVHNSNTSKLGKEESK